MIVKNENHVIVRCLESVKPFIDSWVIVDTGSSDGTQATIKEYMKDIPGELHERPWVNFGHNRNEALALAKNKADYILFIDADDLLCYTEKFIKPALDKDFYYLRTKYAGTTYHRVQLIKSILDWKWVGVVHEVPISPQAKSSEVLEDVSMLIVGGGASWSDPKKYEKYVHLLSQALLEEPNNARYVFYLAQSYHDAQMPELALRTYEKRSAMGGWEEEVFLSLYRIGCLQESLNMPEETIRESHCKAFNYRPSRAEPLFRLSQYYRKKGNYLFGYLLAEFGLKIPRPSDRLFVESWIYEYGLLLEYSICAYWIGHYDQSLHLCNQLLCNQDLPQNIRECVENNLRFAAKKVAEKGF